jgi:hypothetical protein
MEQREYYNNLTIYSSQKKTKKKCVYYIKYS